MDLRSDFVFAARSLRKSPAFTLTALLTIALGVGATTAIFSVVNTVLLRPLPYTEASRLVYIQADMTARSVRDFPMAPGDLPDLRAQGTMFEGVAAVATGNQPLLSEDGSPPERIATAAATPDLFPLLGIRARVGRVFIDEDGIPIPQPPQAAGAQAPQAPPPPGVAVLSYSFWQRRFGGDPGIVGKIIRLGGGSSEIVGVLEPDAELLFPPGLNIARRPDVWQALRVNFTNASRINVFLRFVGRLKPGVTQAQAQAQVDGIVADLRQRFPIKATSGLRWRVEPMHDYLVADVKDGILALMGAVMFVMLIACANVANLLLVRSSARERELTVRAALGASRRDLVRQMLAESALIAGGGAALGLMLATGATALLRALAPANLPRVSDVGMSIPVFLFALFVAAASAVIFGLVPALRASRPDAGAALRNQSRHAGLAGGRMLRNAVVVAEVTLSFVLLVGSGLMVRSFMALQKADPGFVPENVLTFLAPPVGLNTSGQRATYMREVTERLSRLPGVRAVSSGNPLPFDGGVGNARYGPPEAATDPSRFQQADVHVVQPGYWTAMRSKLIDGRVLDETDNDTLKAVMVVDRLLAEKVFPGRSAIGQQLLVRARSNEPELIQIVGVVEHERNVTLAADGREAIYVADGFFGYGAAARWIVRTEGNPMDLAAGVRGEIRRYAPSVPVAELQPMTDFVSRAMAPTRFALVLIGIFAAIAAILAAVGLYGVLATAVRQRTAEIGIRMTFGAEAAGIFRMIIGQGLRLVASGIGCGLLAAFLLTRLMRSLLVGVKPTDPATFALIALFFLAIAFVACWLPARRAAGLDPVAALRDDA